MNFRFVFLCVTLSLNGLQAEDSLSTVTLNGSSEECSHKVQLQRNLCQHKDKILESGINEDILKQALTFKAKNPLLTSPEVFVADYSKNSREKRLYRINVETGEVKKAHVSHGGGYLSEKNEKKSRPSLYGRGVYWGDQDHDGMVDRCQVPDEITKYWPPHFKDNDRENMTRPGFFATKRPSRYSFNKHWLDLEDYGRNAIPMQGLTEEVNSDAEEKMVALNAPRYNSTPGMGEDLVMGRGAYGPAIRPQDREIFQDVPENTIFYAYVPQCEEDMQKVFEQIENWESFCGPEKSHTALEHCKHIENRGRSNGKIYFLRNIQESAPSLNGNGSER